MGDTFFMRLYTKEYLADSKVRVLSREHRGDLVDLWCHCDQEGSLPADPASISRLLGITLAAAKTTLRALRPFFQEQDGRLVSIRLQKAREAREEFTASRRRGAEAANHKRWGRGSLSDAPSESLSDPPATKERCAQRSVVNSQYSVKEPLKPPAGGERSPFGPLTQVEAEVLERVQGFWPEIQPGTRDKSVPRVVGPKLRERWAKACRAEGVSPQLLMLALWCYVEDCQARKQFLKAPQNALSARLFEEFLPAAQAELERQRVGETPVLALPEVTHV